MLKIIWMLLLWAGSAYAVASQAAANQNYTFSGQAIATTNYLYRGISQSSNAIASRVDLNMKNIFYASGLHLNIRVNGSDLGSEFDMVLGYEREFGALIVDLALEKFKFPKDSHRNVLEGYLILAKKFSIVKIGLDLYSEIDSTDDEMFASIGKMFSNGISPRYYGGEIFLESEYINASLGSSGVNSFYTQIELLYGFSWFPTWKTGLTLGYSMNATQSMFLDGASVGLMLKKVF